MIRWTLTAAVLALLVVAPAVRAVYPPAVKDDAKFFSKEGADRANKKVREIYEKYRTDVVVETLASLTAEQEKKLKEDTPERFFARLASDRARELGVHGVYVLLCKNPKYIRIHMDPETQKKAFTPKNRVATVGKIRDQFRDDKFDDGLVEGLTEIESALRTNAAPKSGPK